jgi:hypothetical protein
MIQVTSVGNFNKTLSYLDFLKSGKVFADFSRYGRIGVNALSGATPVESGETANAWTYEVEHSRERHAIYWYNNHVEDGVNIAVIIQYGHGTGTGGYVQGRDYINPAIRPIFDQILNDVWRQVTNG